jgi:hypothetical protein
MWGQDGEVRAWWVLVGIGAGVQVMEAALVYEGSHSTWQFTQVGGEDVRSGFRSHDNGMAYWVQFGGLG